MSVPLNLRARLRCAGLALCLSLTWPVGLSLAADAYTPDGGVYHGELVDGRLHGKGRLEWPYGMYYEGEFRNGLMHGQGVMVAPDWRYEGSFVNGLIEGQGVMMFDDGELYEGQFRAARFHGQGRLSMANGDVYKGQFADDLYHGEGRLERADGRIYIGRFDKGEPVGRFRYFNGQIRYEGELKNWQPYGRGRLLDGEENALEGTFENGVLDGQGSLKTRAGGTYEGGFSKGRFHGQGVLRSPGGDEYRGGFANGLFDGEGVLKYAKPRPDGRSEERGVWRHGRLHDPQQEARKYENIETMLYNQPALLAAAEAALQAQDPDRIDLFWLGVAGDGRQEVFRREVEYVRSQFERDYGTAGRSLSLINSRTTVGAAPLATHTSLQRALRTLAATMDVDEDILFLFLTSHGSEDHKLVLELDGVELPDLPAATLAQMLRDSGIRWKVIVISACYSGGFIDALKDEHTLVITAARHDRTSFGCSDDNDFTYFGRAYFEQSLTPETGFVEAFAKTQGVIAEWEKEMFEQALDKRGLQHSEPMMHAPEPIQAHLQRWRAQLATQR